MCVCIFRQHFFVNESFIKHNRHLMSTYFLLDPFEFPYYFYRIRGELIYVLSIVVCIPSTFCPTLGHHQGTYITFVIDSPLMMAQSRAESTRDTYNYGQYINQFPPNTIKVIREFKRIQKKICRHKMSIMFNETCIYIYIYIYIYAPPWGLSTLAKEFTAAVRIMQSFSNELSTLVSGKA